MQSLYNIVANATVSLSGKGGRGVLVCNHLVLTAAHCIKWDCDGYMALEAYFEKIKTGKIEFTAQILAVEPVSDIAVLGPPDTQRLPREYDLFQESCNNIKPVPVYMRNDLPETFRVHIYTHKAKWITGQAKYQKPWNSIYIETDEQVENGDSGGPIINDSGEIVGIVSSMNEKYDNQSKCNGFAPLPHLTLPVWVCNRILENKDY